MQCLLVAWHGPWLTFVGSRRHAALLTGMWLDLELEECAVCSSTVGTLSWLRRCTVDTYFRPQKALFGPNYASTSSVDALFGPESVLLTRIVKRKKHCSAQTMHQRLLLTRCLAQKVFCGHAF